MFDRLRSAPDKIPGQLLFFHFSAVPHILRLGLYGRASEEEAQKSLWLEGAQRPEVAHSSEGGGSENGQQ